MSNAPRIICLGEGMVEERIAPDGAVTRHYGGDALNVAVHLARGGVNVAFATALGADGDSDELVSAWAAEGVDTTLILRHEQRRMGTYRIAVDASGERSFSYDRANSAARDMCALADAGWLAAVAEADLLLFSLISLAILPDNGREALCDLARAVRARGGEVAFDGNYRPTLWENTEAAQLWRDRAAACADIGLPTLEDEVALGRPADPGAVAAYWQALGCREVVVKLGAAGCLLPDGSILPPPEVLKPVDTSGAGDAFDAGYLGARLAGMAPHSAALAGHELAGWCVMRTGAIPPGDAQAG